MSIQHIVLAIDGLRYECPRSAEEIERVLARLDGVVFAHVNYATERAGVVYDPARVTTARMVAAIRGLGYDVPVEGLLLSSDDLLYATSARAIENRLYRQDGVVSASADLGATRVKMDVLSGYERLIPRSILAQLGFPEKVHGAPDPRPIFLFRTALLIAFEFITVWSAGAHAGRLASPQWLHVPLVVLMLAFAAFVAAWPFFHSAFEVALRGEFDGTVIVALLASALAFASLPLGILSPSTPWSLDAGFVAAMTLTTGWFVIRALRLWLLPLFSRTVPNMSVSSVPVSGRRVKDARRFVVPVMAGAITALGMVTFYLAILTALQSPAHALGQLANDAVWVGLVALGFGAQIGLYTYLHLVLKAAETAGAAVAASAGTGISTLGMLACCAHHLTDIAPLVGLTGASALSGAIGFLSEWKYVFIALGLVMNLFGIVVTGRTIWKSQAHLNAMTSFSDGAPACH